VFLMTLWYIQRQPIITRLVRTSSCPTNDESLLSSCQAGVLSVFVPWLILLEDHPFKNCEPGGSSTWVLLKGFRV
jgi:hypothetical protein